MNGPLLQNFIARAGVTTAGYNPLPVGNDVCEKLRTLGMDCGSNLFKRHWNSRYTFNIKILA
jgi:hypothetical protein